MTQQKGKKRSSEEMRGSSKKEQQKKAAAAAAAAAKVAQLEQQTSDSESDADMSDAEEDIEDVIGGNTDFYFDDGQADGDDDEANGASAKKRVKKDAAENDDATGADGDDELIITDVDSKDVEYRVEEADEASKSTTQIGLDAPENAALFAKCLHEILSATIDISETSGGDIVLKQAQGKVKRRLDLLNKELAKENRERKHRFERLLFERQNHVKPHIDTLDKERQLKKLSKSGLVQLLNEVMTAKRQKKEQMQKVEENPYAILKNFNYKLHH